MNSRFPGYPLLVIPDDTAGRPLTPGEQAAIADLERRLLLETPAPVRNHRVGDRRRRPGPARPVGPLLVLLGTALLLVAVLVATGAGVPGIVAVLLSTAATALVWPLLPPGLGGPVRPRRRPYRSRGPVPRRR